MAAPVSRHRPSLASGGENGDRVPDDGAMLEEDRALLAAVAAGDRAAQEALAVRLLARFRRICRALLQDASDADDASQSAMIEVIRSARLFRGEGRLEPWADRIAVRTALRQVRRRVEWRVRFDDQGDPDATAAPPDERLIYMGLPMEQLLSRLTEAQRRVVYLRFGLDYSIRDLAEELSVSENTVKYHLREAMVSLRRWLRGKEAP